MLLENKVVIRFEGYEIDRQRWTVQWRQQPIALRPKCLDVLLHLIDHRDRVVSKDELLETLWAGQFVEESNLTQHIFLLRKALSRHETGAKVIETVAGRGYRFVAAVEEETPTLTEIVISASTSVTEITIEEEEIEFPADTAVVTPGLPALSVSSLTVRPAIHRRMIWTVGISVALTALAVAAWFGWQHWEDRSGGAPVQVVLAPMEGTTGDAVLDKSLVQVLRMDLAQSPYVSVVPSSTVRATLIAMMHKPDEPMTATMVREVCERTNSQEVLTGNIARAGQHFLITEEATNCVDGAVVGQAKDEAEKLEELPNVMGKLAANLRQKLGESRRSIARFNMQLFEQNTASLDALKAYTQGTQKLVEGDVPGSIALLKNSIAADPLFAAAHYNLAAAYGTAGDDLHTRESIDKAYALRDRATKPTQFGILVMYASEYTGDEYELLRTYQSWVDLYPNSSQAWSGLSAVQSDLGMDKESLASILRTVQLLPHSQGMLANLSMEQMKNHNVQAALATCERAIANNLDGDGIRVRYLQVAYLLKDSTLLQAQRAWFAAHPQAVGVLGVESQIAMAEGRFNDARRMIEQIRGIHRQQGLFGPDDEATKFGAVDLMQTGDLEAGKKLFQQAPVDIEEGQEVLGLVYIGDIAAAQSALHTEETKYPHATMTNLFWAPRTKAAIAILEHKPAEAAALLEIARPLDQIGRFLPWHRGNAYLAAGQPALAEKEYRSVIDHPEFDPTSPYISLSWLGLGEALAAQGNRADAIGAYQHFFALWAHADPDAAYLKQAKQEFARLQETRATR